MSSRREGRAQLSVGFCSGAPAECSSLIPERVRVADVETACLAAPRLVRGVRGHKALAYNLRAVADLLDVRVARS
jgi:hypothetical protein